MKRIWALMMMLAALSVVHPTLVTAKEAVPAPATPAVGKVELPAVLAQATPAPAAPAPAIAPAPAAAPAAASAAAAPASSTAPLPVPNKGDTAWMMTATAMVILMTIPGLALFYGGLVRGKNMLSVLMQVFVIFAMILVLWVVYGYTLAFGGGGTYFGNLDKLFLKGVTPPPKASVYP